MEGFMMLSMLSLAMFFGSYLAGSVPLAMTFSESKLRFVSIFGAGLLVGTALAVIIPEGVQSIYEAESELHNRQYHKEAEHILEESAHQPPFNPPRIPPKDAELNPPNDAKVPVPAAADKSASNPTDTESRNKREPDAKEPDAEGPPNVRKPLQIKAAVEKSAELSSKGEHEHHHHHDENLSHHAHGVIGVALVAGFVFMLIVDQITRSTTGRGDNGTRGRYKITATVGLVVHAAADGIALGAASSTKHSEIQFIVFVAIMLHKAPAAFGLVTFLLVEGLEKMRIRRHLLIFSLAAPLTALFTYMGIAKGGSETLTSMSSTGVLMLFSAGTFLYVSTVHVLPELVNSAPKSAGYHVVDAGGLPTNSSSSQTSSASGHSHHASHGFKLNEVFALILGAGVPALLSIGHSH